FFFQAEDGIRDFHVTGVQTCALPISMAKKNRLLTPKLLRRRTERTRLNGRVRNIGMVSPPTPAMPRPVERNNPRFLCKLGGQTLLHVAEIAACAMNENDGRNAGLRLPQLHIVKPQPLKLPIKRDERTRWRKELRDAETRPRGIGSECTDQKGKENQKCHVPITRSDAPSFNFKLQRSDTRLSMIEPGIERKRAAIGVERAFPVPQIFENDTKPRQRLEMARLQPERLLDIPQRRCTILAHIMNGCTAMPTFRIGRRESHHLIEIEIGAVIIPLTQCIEPAPHQKVDAGAARGEPEILDRPLDPLSRSLARRGRKLLEKLVDKSTPFRLA